MSNDFFDYPSSPARLTPGTPAMATEVNAIVDDISSGFDGVQDALDSSLAVPEGATVDFPQVVGERKHRLLYFDDAGNLTVTPGASPAERAGKAQAYDADGNLVLTNYSASLPGVIEASQQIEANKVAAQNAASSATGSANAASGFANDAAASAQAAANSAAEAAAIVTDGLIDDGAPSSTQVWSSQKVADELADKLDADDATSFLSDDDLGTSDGKIPVVGNFGIGVTELTATGDNLNDLVVEGKYARTSGASNNPFGNTALVEVTPLNANNVLQIATDTVSGEMRKRVRASGTWGAWDTVGAGGLSTAYTAVSFNGGTVGINLGTSQHYRGALSSNTTISITFPAGTSGKVQSALLDILDPSSRTATLAIAGGGTIVFPGYTAMPLMRPAGPNRFLLQRFGTETTYYAYYLG